MCRENVKSWENKELQKKIIFFLPLFSFQIVLGKGDKNKVYREEMLASTKPSIFESFPSTIRIFQTYSHHPPSSYRIVDTIPLPWLRTYHNFTCARKVKDGELQNFFFSLSLCVRSSNGGDFIPAVIVVAVYDDDDNDNTRPWLSFKLESVFFPFLLHLSSVMIIKLQHTQNRTTKN